jgi:hypothetical protein
VVQKRAYRIKKKEKIQHTSPEHFVTIIYFIDTILRAQSHVGWTVQRYGPCYGLFTQKSNIQNVYSHFFSLGCNAGNWSTSVSHFTIEPIFLYHDFLCSKQWTSSNQTCSHRCSTQKTSRESCASLHWRTPGKTYSWLAVSLFSFVYHTEKKCDCVFKICRVTKYAEEDTAYGINYFMKVSIGDGLFIHIRVHRQQHHNIYDFYSLHETIKHNEATCIFTEGIFRMELQ